VKVSGEYINQPSPSHHHKQVVCLPFPVMGGLLLFYPYLSCF
jgi:hypothetical protein